LQGCREAAAVIDLLQGPVSFPASSGNSKKVIETTLVSAGRILEESLKYPNDIARHHTLRSVAAALAQALVPANQNQGRCRGDNSQQAVPTEQEQKRNELQNIINLHLSNEVLDWDAATLLSQNALLASNHNNAVHLPSSSFLQANNVADQPFSTLDSLLQQAVHVPSLDAICGAPSMLLRTAQQVPLPSFNASSTAVRNHSQEAWTAYLTIRPQVKRKIKFYSRLIIVPYLLPC